MKIAIVVHGRFHAFDLARALIERGHDVTVFTNYPKWAVAAFGVPREKVRTFVAHGMLSRGVGKLPMRLTKSFEPAIHRFFGRWAWKGLERDSWDVVHCWSGVAEETLIGLRGRTTLTILMRGSAHIRTQDRLLAEEEKRTGYRLERPSAWMIEREEREYELAQRVAVLSRFASDSFITRGISRERLRLLPLGVDRGRFAASGEQIEERCRRIQNGDPLRVLFVGALSAQKGVWELLQVARGLSTSRFRFHFVGPVTPEVGPSVPELKKTAEVVGKKRQGELPSVYGSADIFLFPTIQDGYAQVLSQAAAAGLPILTTTNCAGPDFIRDGENGWVVPIRSPETLIERLKWCDNHREDLARMVRRVSESFKPRTWTDVARDFEAACEPLVR